MAIQPTTCTTHQASHKNNAKNDPLKQAWIDLTERVSVAGWKEALSEEIINIRRMFQISLVILSILSIYYSAMVLRQWKKSGYKDDIEDIFDPPQLPFSNVTICAQVALNQSFIRNNISIPGNLLQKFINQRNMSENELYRQLTLYLAYIQRPHTFEQTFSTFFTRISRQNPQLKDFSAFTEAASLTCNGMFRKCWFNEIEFDCCQKAVRSLDDDGICYQLVLNMDSDNAYASESTYQQTKPGPSGGLTVELSMSLDNFPWIENDRANGFRVYVSPVPYSPFQSPLGAPSGAETFIKVTPSMHNLSINCTSHGQLGKSKSFMYYDPDGYDCASEGAEQFSMKYVSCTIAWWFYRPNASTVCNADAIHLSEMILTSADAEEHLRSLAADNIGMPADRIKKTLEQVQIDMQKMMSGKSFCKKHCTRWTYDSSSSFIDLDHPGDTGSMNTMFSRIHVYYGDLSYRTYNEVKEYSSYLAFCDFGNVVGLYWGMSIVSFMHVLYYVPLYFYVRWRHRRRQTVVQVISLNKRS